MTRGVDNAILLIRSVPQGQALKVSSEPELYQSLKLALFKQHRKGCFLNITMVRRNNVIYLSNSSVGGKT